MANITVKTSPNESFEKTLRRFKRAFEKSGINQDIKKHLRYTKPSEKRNRLKQEKKRKKKQNKKP